MTGSSFPPFLWLPLAWLAFVGGMMVLIFFVALWEKRRSWPFAATEAAGPGGRPVAEFDANDPYAPSAALGDRPTLPGADYQARAGGMAAGLGFAHLQSCGDLRGGLYQTRWDFWVSRERYVLAIIAGGTIAKIPHQTTRLHTRLADGTWIVSLDNEKGTHVDLTKRLIEGLHPDADFATLAAWHRKRVLAAGSPAVPFGADPLAECRSFRIDRDDELAARGLIRFLDPERAVHRFTVRGAAIYVVRMHARMYRRKFRPDTSRRFAAAPATAPRPDPAGRPGRDA